MRIVRDYPPNFDEIDAAFHIRGKRIIFAWGETIFAPESESVPPHLLAHERIHGMRQGSDIRGWWRRYIDDEAFRLDEEIPAHRAEYQFLIRNGNRHDRRKALKAVSGRLAGPLYGRLITATEARTIVRSDSAFRVVRTGAVT